MVGTNQTGTTMSTFCIDTAVQVGEQLSTKQLLGMESDFQIRLEAQGLTVLKTCSNYRDTCNKRTYWTTAVVKENVPSPLGVWVTDEEVYV